MLDGESEGSLDKLGKSDGAFEGRIDDEGMTEGAGVGFFASPTSKADVCSLPKSPDMSIGVFIPSALILMLPSPYEQHIPSPYLSAIVKVYFPTSTHITLVSEGIPVPPVISSIVTPLSFWRSHEVSWG